MVARIVFILIPLVLGGCTSVTAPPVPPRFPSQYAGDGVLVLPLNGTDPLMLSPGGCVTVGFRLHNDAARAIVGRPAVEVPPPFKANVSPVRANLSPHGDALVDVNVCTPSASASRPWSVSVEPEPEVPVVSYGGHVESQ